MSFSFCLFFSSDRRVDRSRTVSTDPCYDKISRGDTEPLGENCSGDWTISRGGKASGSLFVL